jgi:hypothetical protein
MEEYIIKDALEFPVIRKLIPYLQNSSGFIAGGVFKDLFLNSDFRDLDFFFENIDEYRVSLNQLTINQKCVRTYENQNAVGIYDNIDKINIDLVTKIFGSPKQILDSFDFTVSKFSLFRDNNKKFKVIYHQYFFEDLATKHLRFNVETANPVAQLSRVIKYSGYGFKINKPDFLNLIKQINELEPESLLNFSDNNFNSYYE